MEGFEQRARNRMACSTNVEQNRHNDVEHQSTVPGWIKHTAIIDSRLQGLTQRKCVVKLLL